jgi:hypothetical protein
MIVSKPLMIAIRMLLIIRVIVDRVFKDGMEITSYDGAHFGPVLILVIDFLKPH